MFSAVYQANNNLLFASLISCVFLCILVVRKAPCLGLDAIGFFEKTLSPPATVAAARSSNPGARCRSVFLSCHGLNAAGQLWDCESVTTPGGRPRPSPRCAPAGPIHLCGRVCVKPLCTYIRAQLYYLCITAFTRLFFYCQSCILDACGPVVCWTSGGIKVLTPLH